jgi:hypothetical protein
VKQHSADPKQGLVRILQYQVTPVLWGGMSSFVETAFGGSKTRSRGILQCQVILLLLFTPLRSATSKSGVSPDICALAPISKNLLDYFPSIPGPIWAEDVEVSKHSGMLKIACNPATLEWKPTLRFVTVSID